MRILKFLLVKEFKQIFRNKAMLPMLFVLPLIQLLVLPLAADYEIKNIFVSIVDHDHSTYSRNLVTKIGASGYFRTADYGTSYDRAFRQVERGKSDLILEIPEGFEKNLVRENGQRVFIAVNAINGVKANLGSAYLTQIIADYNSEIRLKWIQPENTGTAPVIEVTSSNWFNPFMNYRFFMVPGILVVLVTMVSAYMCALNLVKEKEIGTIEQINVTPIKKYQFILGKLIPFWIIALFVFSVGLFVIARWVYGIVPLGSLLLLYGFLPGRVARVGPAHFHLFRNTATGHVHRIFLHHDFYVDERALHPHRQHARLGQGDRPLQPGHLFHRSDADGRPQGKRFPRHTVPLPGHRRVCPRIERMGHTEL